MNLDHYNRNRGIFSALHEHGGRITGFWMEGNNYRNKSRLYGAYPPSYLKRMRLLFPEEFRDGRVLHLFSGSIPSSKDAQILTLDINPDMNPDILCDASEVDKYLSVQFDLILADPPYDHNYVRYGTEPVNKRKVVHACSKIIKPGGHLVWLDTIMPQWAKKDGWRLAGTIALLQSTNHKVRVATILEKVA
jgi:hypothetical protein